MATYADVWTYAGGSGGECDAEAVADKLCDKEFRARLLAELEAARTYTPPSSPLLTYAHVC
jgi:hypothetical protein